MPGRYPFSGDHTRVAAVITAATATDALDRAWAQTAEHGLLPVDAIWSLYPDGDGFVRLAIGLDDATDTELRRRAERADQSLDDFLAELLNEAVSRDTARRLGLLREELDQVLQKYKYDEVLRVLLTAAAPDTS